MINYRCHHTDSVNYFLVGTISPNLLEFLLKGFYCMCSYCWNKCRVQKLCLLTISTAKFMGLPLFTNYWNR